MYEENKALFFPLACDSDGAAHSANVLLCQVESRAGQWALDGLCLCYNYAGRPRLPEQPPLPALGWEQRGRLPINEVEMGGGDPGNSGKE